MKRSIIPAPILSLVLVTAVAYLTYLRGYSEPAAFFWDENYHVAQAQKYLHGVFFMEPHPPLGKLVIALGEWLLRSNAASDQFLGVSYARDLPPGFSFAGYRLFPALFALLSAPLFAYAMRLVTGRWLWGILLSSLYLFDNALIVHSRGAMLESTQIFFLLVALVAALRVITADRALPRFEMIGLSVLLGLGLGGAIATKHNALVALLLIPYVYIGSAQLKARFLPSLLACGLSLFVVYFGVWATHFALAHTIDSRLSDDGYFTSNTELRELISRGAPRSVGEFVVLYRASLRFAAKYGKGVPALNLCKADENGSHPLMWPFGGRAINYRWDRSGDHTSYLYLQSNPGIWLIGLLGVVGGASLVIAPLLVGSARPLRHPALLRLFMIMYLAYMGGMMMVERVMYLYHYFIPLLISFILFAIVIAEIANARRISSALIHAILFIVAGGAIASYLYFAPLTYAQPLTDGELAERSWARIWDLRCANCAPHNGFALPKCDWQVIKTESSPSR